MERPNISMLGKSREKMRQNLEPENGKCFQLTPTKIIFWIAEDDPKK